ncbi:LacI family DNA-binding transcriptional regulator [Sphaerisporangium sp. NPDC051017]|uniref:LacI family DNA-binding transcriptional regulator n=1 Tax=Sphaerisporangium sp. NPDC051017 TaxID=3154636 RepID=UPI003420633A
MVNRFPVTPRTTIKDVALLAGVSKATVSKFLSATDYYVSEKTREKIESAIKELNYYPNALAQGLSSRRSYAIGVVVASITNPFYPELVAGVEEVIDPAGYTLLLGTSAENSDKEADVVRTMIQRRVDGAIVASAFMRDGSVQRLVNAGINVIVASRELARPLVDTVVIDNRLGGRMAAEHLRGHGFGRAVFLSGPLDVLAFRQRFEGFRSVYREADSAVHLARTSELAEATEAAFDLLRDLPRPSAVCAANDTLALGLMTAAHTLGLRIPDDIALIGFDDIWVGRIPGVSLTTVDSRARQVGAVAAGLLAERIGRHPGESRGARKPPERHVLAPQLIVRGSCGCS